MRRQPHRAGSFPQRNPMGQMYNAWFYPPGREKIHAQGALDLALWDLKGKALPAPVHQLLGGMMRNHLRVLRHRTAAVRDDRRGCSAAHDGAGSRQGDYRVRFPGLSNRGRTRPGGRQLQHAPAGARAAQQCKEVREGVGRRRLGESTSTRSSTSPMRCAHARRSRSTSPTSSRTRWPTRRRSRRFRNCAR